MTALDIIVLLLLIGGFVLGGMKGFVHEMLTLGAWVLAIVALKILHTPVSASLEDFVGTWAGAAVLAFALIFGVVFVLGRIVASRIGGATKRSVIGPLDRVLGAGFGMLKGLIVATLIYLAGNLVYDIYAGRNAPRPAWMADSRTYPLLNASGSAMVDLVEWRRGTTADPAANGNSVENSAANER